MPHRVIFVALLLNTLVMSLQEDPQNTEYEYDDDYYDDLEPISDSEEIQQTKDITSIPAKNLKEDKRRIQAQRPKLLKVERDREELTTKKPIARYEVTELVIDVPDESTRRVPIITNFTLTRPLNFAGIADNKTDDVPTNVKDDGDEVINSMFSPDKPKVNNNRHAKGSNNKFNLNNEKPDYFSNLSPEDSFEEEFDKEFGSDEDDFDIFEAKEEPKPKKGFKDHIQSFRKRIVNGFKNVVNKHKDGIHDSLRKIVNGLHKAVSRHKFHGQDDNVGYHDGHRDYGED